MKDSKLYWGWYVVTGAFLILGVGYGARYCLGVFVKPMSLEQGWPVSVISIAASIMIFFYGVGGIFSGRLLDHAAPKWIITLGVILFGSGFILAPLLTAPWQFYIVYGLLCGLGSSCMGAVVCGATISKWFVRKRGTVIGIASIGIGTGTMLLAPLAGYIVKVYSWQTGFVLLGITIIIIGVAAAQIFMGRTRPEDYGLLPDGDIRPYENGDLPEEAAAPLNFSALSILKDSRFWVMTSCYSLAVMVWASISVHQVAYALDQGIDGIAAASAVGLIGIASIAGRYFFGVFSDRARDAKYLASLGFVLMSLAMLVLLLTRSAESFYLYAVLFGFGYGSMAPLMPFLMADRFGRQILGSAYGLMIFFTAGLGGSLGPVLAGYIYDRFGSYAYAWQINILALVLVAVFILRLKPRDSQERS